MSLPHFSFCALTFLPLCFFGTAARLSWDVWFLPEQKKTQATLRACSLNREECFQATLSQPILPKLVLPLGCDKDWAPGSWCKGAAVPAKPMPSAMSQSRKQDLSSYPHPEETLLNIWRTQTSGKSPLAVVSVLGTAFNSAPSRPHMPQLEAEGWGSGVGVCS